MSRSGRPAAGCSDVRKAEGVKSLVRRAASRLRTPARRSSPGLLSVVVDITDAHLPFLDECLRSLTGTEQPLEVLLSAFGPAERVREAARRHTADPRVRLVDGVGTDAAAARTAGLAAARGSFLAFATASDVARGDGLGRLVQSLARSGSDLAVGRVAPPRGVRRWSLLAVDRPRQRTSAAELPLALTDDFLGNRVFRREFWDRAGLGLDAAAGVHDVLPALRGYLVADAFDVLPELVYRRHNRAVGAPIGTIPPVAPHLLPWLRQVGALAPLAEERGLGDHWLRALLDGGAQPFLADTEAFDGGQWSALVQAVGAWVDDARGAATWGQVRAERRTRAALAASDRRRDLERFNASRWYDARNVPTSAVDGTVRAAWDVQPLAEDCRSLAEDEVGLVASLRSVRRVDEATLGLEVWAFLRPVDMQGAEPGLAAWLVHARGVRLPLRVTRHDDAGVTSFGNDRYQNYDAGAFSLALPLAEAAAWPGSWSLELELEVHGIRRRGGLTHRAPGPGPLPQEALLVGGSRIELRSRPRQPLQLHVAEAGSADQQDRAAAPHQLAVDGIEADGKALRLRGSWSGPGTVTVQLGGPASWPATEVVLDGDRLTAVVPMDHDGVPPEAGTYAVTADGQEVVAPYDVVAGVADVLSPSSRWSVRRTADEALQVQVRPPLADDALGPWAQDRLHAASRGLDLEPGAAYFQSYRGDGATDSPRAIHDELQRRGTRLACHWGVADLSVQLPPGAVPVVIGSPEWHRVIASARYLVNNVDFDRRFEKRPGQRFLQTFHGYPSKAMGKGLWAAKNFSPLRVEAELQRTMRGWDVIVVPTPEMALHYREQYGYVGPVFDRGLPRNDALVAPGHEEVRRRTRDLLGIAADQTAVLYAPTWRDELASDYEKAPATLYLDADRAAAALGPGHVLLMRGHRFEVRPGPVTGARVIDVSRHPEVNDLVLAADVGVFDYSSIRFDFAVTGKPMLFLVPDVGDYTAGGRGFLFPYEETTPGPLLRTTDEVVAALRDLPEVVASHAAGYEVFNRRFNAFHDGRAAARLVDEFFAEEACR